MQAELAVDSTRGLALSYHAGMRNSLVLMPLLFILADDIGCKDDSPKGGEFGAPCGEVDTPCADGLECYIGYCEEKCVDDGDCQKVEGYRHECDFGLCHILCDEMTQMCPQTLETPLECIQLWCSGGS